MKDIFTDAILNDKIRNGIQIVGIGTDKVIHDSFGPLVATLIKEAKLKHFCVRGDFSDLFHGLNINKKARTLNKDVVTIAIDACVGKKENVDKITFRPNKAIYPGKALDKKLTPIGNHSIVYTVSDDASRLMHSDCRMGDIYAKAKELVEYFKELDIIIARKRKEASKKMAYYAVKNGNTVEKGIFTDWETCKAEVNGAKGVAYKKFKNIEDANEFLGIVTKLDIAIEEEFKKKESIEAFKKKEVVIDDDTCIAYVDGSFESNRCSYGVIFIKDDKVIYENGQEVKTWTEMRNVSGEIQGAMVAVEEAYKMGFKNIIIHYDYEGIEKWVTDEWKAKKDYTKQYMSYMKEMLNHIDISFVKVKGHSGDKWNDYVDRVAGMAIKQFV